MKMHEKIWMFGLAGLLALSACGTPEDDTPTTGPEGNAVESTDEDGFQEVDLADQLGEAQTDSKSDAPSQCGTDSCSADLCGYDCSTSGQQCDRACDSADRDADTYVLFNVSGARDARLDSRDLEYKPKLALNNVLIYGCELWDFSSGEYDGLEISYKKVYNASFQLGGPKNIGENAKIYIKPFEGPGSYQATGFYAASSAERGERNYFWGKETCGVELEIIDGGAVRGEFVCGSVPNRQDGNSSTVRMVGEFECGIGSMNPEFIALD